MTAAELIEALGKFPPESRVMFEGEVHSYEISEAKLYTWKDGTTDVELS